MQKDRRKGGKEQKASNTKMLWAMLAGLAVLVAIILILTKVDRTPATKEKKTSDDEKIDKIKNYESLADEKLYYIKIEMAKDVSPYKFILRDIEKVESFSKSALELDSTLSTSWERLGYVNSHIHGHQAFKRYQSYTNREIEDKAKQAEKEAITYFVLAEAYYKKALLYGPKDSANIYLLWGESYELQEGFEPASVYFKTAMEIEPDIPKYEAKYIKALLTSGNTEQALYFNSVYMKKYPESDIPYLNYAMYYYNMGDTLQAVDNYERAVEKGTRPEVGKFLHRYFSTHGNPDKADYYRQKSIEAEQNWNPEKY